MELTGLDLALGGALLAYVSYRVGWTVGAHRMSAALSGRSTGIFGAIGRLRARRAAKRLIAQVKAGETRFVDSEDEIGRVGFSVHTPGATGEVEAPRKDGSFASGSSKYDGQGQYL